MLAPVAAGYLLWLGAQGTSTFTTEGAGHVLLVVGTMTLLCAKEQDRTVMPGETLTLEDGARCVRNEPQKPAMHRL